jgi:hypothetical protein
MGFLQQLHLVIKYKKVIHNKVVGMFLRPVINASKILRYNPLAHESYAEQYAKDDYFRDVYDALTHGNQQSYDYMHDNLLYHDANPLPSGRDPLRIVTKTTLRVNPTLCLSHKGIWISGIGESRCISTTLGKCRNAKHQEGCLLQRNKHMPPVTH